MRLKFVAAVVTALIVASGIGATAVAAGPLPTTAATPGALNDWNCQPTAAHPEPVVLVHGLGANADVNWFFHAPILVNEGYCVFSLTYGTGVLGPFVGGLASMRDSAAELGGFVDEI